MYIKKLDLKYTTIHYLLIIWSSFYFLNMFFIHVFFQLMNIGELKLLFLHFKNQKFQPF